ncbi:MULTISPECIES: universal stress protein [unclassified Haladaptatus]|uniref:universal stress protein n=1 Tax=unclassified Haladaptatus TaxID=2622732 RepID=UPI0023E8CA6D|nr:MULTISPECIES: universal stress protein [unclassified Haladaptatus]
MYDTILVPTDGSDGAALAENHAISLARVVGAHIHFLYVVDTSHYGEVLLLDDIQAGLEREGTKVIEKARDGGTKAGVATAGTVVVGVPDDEIVDYATEHDVDLVVMGTHGRRGVSRYFLGSTAERVVRMSPVPVLTIREGPA